MESISNDIDDRIRHLRFVNRKPVKDIAEKLRVSQKYIDIKINQQAA